MKGRFMIKADVYKLERSYECLLEKGLFPSPKQSMHTSSSTVVSVELKPTTLIGL